MEDEDRIFAVASYLIPFIGGLVVYLLKKGSYERFHAVQSILFWGAVVAVSIALNLVAAIFHLIPVIGKIIGSLIDIVSLVFGLAVLVIWLILMWKAYKKEKMELPVLSGQAEKYSK